MSRNVMVAMGVLLWTSFAIVVVLHALAGDWVGPLLAGIVVTVTVTAYHLRQRLLRTS